MDETIRFLIGVTIFLAVIAYERLKERPSKTNFIIQALFPLNKIRTENLSLFFLIRRIDSFKSLFFTSRISLLLF